MEECRRLTVDELVFWLEGIAEIEKNRDRMRQAAVAKQRTQARSKRRGKR